MGHIVLTEHALCMCELAYQCTLESQTVLQGLLHVRLMTVYHC